MSLHGLTDESLHSETDATLAGSYRLRDGEGSMRIVVDHDGGYIFESASLEKSSGGCQPHSYRVEQVTINGSTWLDFSDKKDINNEELLALAVHIFARVDREKDSIKLTLLKPAWVNRKLGSRANLESFSLPSQEMFLYSEPSTLRALLKAAQTDPQALEKDVFILDATKESVPVK